MKLRITTNGTEIKWADRVSGRPVFQFDAENVHVAIERRVFVHGAKQIIGDAAAKAKGTSMAEKVAAMRKAAEGLIDGTWGTRQPSMPRADVFAALVGLGKFADSERNREVWGKLTERQRDALADSDEVRAWIAAHADEEVDMDEVMAEFE